jgi:hypothetical protein
MAAVMVGALMENTKALGSTQGIRRGHLEDRDHGQFRGNSHLRQLNYEDFVVDTDYELTRYDDSGKGSYSSNGSYSSKSSKGKGSYHHADSGKGSRNSKGSKSEGYSSEKGKGSAPTKPPMPGPPSPMTELPTPRPPTSPAPTPEP